jgi:hypothetical protein
MNSRTKGNDTLRKRLKNFLKRIKSGEEIYTNHIILHLSKLNKNYSISSARVTNLLKENIAVKFIKSGVWMKV